MAGFNLFALLGKKLQLCKANEMLLFIYTLFFSMLIAKPSIQAKLYVLEACDV